MTDPHGNQPIFSAGPPPQQADGVVLMLHGRGATSESILSLYPMLEVPTIAALAPQAGGGTWYPYSFLAPIEQNQPYLDSALRRVVSIVDDLLSRNVPAKRIAILGFSQGACLTCEYAARHPRGYGALIAFTGGLIGPPGTPRTYKGSLAQTPVFLGTSDPDPHVPFERVEETRDVFDRMSAIVELRSYPNMAHTINTDELDAARVLLRRMISTGTAT